MRMHGYCEKCHKIKMVTVRFPIKGVAVGICAQCEEKRDAQTRAR